MCNIAILKAGVKIPYEKIYNVTHNNHHSFGIVLKDVKNKKLEIIKKCDQNGNDPKEIHDILESNVHLERYLHVRQRTEGPIDLDNTHPFTAYYSDARHIEFMHNGTLLDFKPRSSDTYENGIRKTVTHENISDSKKFNDEFLAPLLLTMSGENGKADIHDPVFRKVINKFWGHSSKGLLICNDLEPSLINPTDWKELDFGDGKIWSSNNDYWDKLVRGPVFEIEKKKKEEEERVARIAKFQEGDIPNRRAIGRNLTNLRDVDLKPTDELSEDLSNIFEDHNIWTDKGIASLVNLTAIEFEDFVKRDNAKAAELLIYITSNYDDLYNRKKRMVKYIKDIKANGKTTFDVKDERELSGNA